MREHLLFYCRLKGVPARDETRAVLALLDAVGLSDVPDRFAGQLSGGMKRRLSVAMSLVRGRCVLGDSAGSNPCVACVNTVPAVAVQCTDRCTVQAGDPDIIFMDEPTTGTDPHTRRQLWSVIADAARGRCILLTTHRMDEADVLCSRIAIMAHGQLRCIGPQQVLKSKYGDGYMLRVNFTPALRTQVCALVAYVPLKLRTQM